MTETHRQAALRKARWRLLPILFFSTTLANLDRFNVSIAAPTMNRDIGLAPAIYGLGVGLFFAAYALCEVPSNLALSRFGARRWIARIMFTWGLVSVGSAFVQGSGTFVLSRVLLGVAEAGFLPGVLAYLSLWFPAEHRARMFALILMTAPLSVVVGSPLGVWLLSLDGLGGLQGWQWLFILEGGPSIVMALLVWKLLRDRPTDAGWLTASEAQALAEAPAVAKPAHKVGFKATCKALMTPSVFIAMVVLGCLGGINHAVTFWLPQIIKSANWTDTQMGLATAFPYACGILSMLFWSRHSDRTRERRWHMGAPAVAAGIMLVLSVFTTGLAGRLVWLTLAMSCVFAVQAVFWSSVSSILPAADRAVGIAVINACGALLAMLSPAAIGVSKQLTGGFDAAFAILGGLGVVGGLMAVALASRMLPASTELAPGPSAG